MSKLITHHDPYHVHKILGLLALLHYAYRFSLVFQTGSAFPPNEPVAVSCAGVFLHGLLSWSSLLLPLPVRRNFNQPMIWPEFRLHSIVFATRHVVTTLLTLANLWPDDRDVFANAFARAVIVMGTVKAASIVTEKYGDHKLRTVNAMAYPASLSAGQCENIKLQYTKAQFGAAATCLFSDATINFAGLFAIQIAPFMMTLVRKGKVSTGTTHCVYAFGLFLGFTTLCVRLLSISDDGSNNKNDSEFLSKLEGLKVACVIFFPSSKLRKLGASAQMVWASNVAVSAVIYPLLLEDWIDAKVSVDMARAFFWIITVAVTIRQIRAYAPLFGFEDGITVRLEATGDNDSSVKKNMK